MCGLTESMPSITHPPIDEIQMWALKLECGMFFSRNNYIEKRLTLFFQKKSFEHEGRSKRRNGATIPAKFTPKNSNFWGDVRRIFSNNMAIRDMVQQITWRQAAEHAVSLSSSSQRISVTCNLQLILLQLALVLHNLPIENQRWRMSFWQRVAAASAQILEYANQWNRPIFVWPWDIEAAALQDQTLGQVEDVQILDRARSPLTPPKNLPHSLTFRNVTSAFQAAQRPSD